jgi:hypothetical protein
MTSNVNSPNSKKSVKYSKSFFNVAKTQLTILKNSFINPNASPERSHFMVEKKMIGGDLKNRGSAFEINDSLKNRIKSHL